MDNNDLFIAANERDQSMDPAYKQRVATRNQNHPHSTPVVLATGREVRVNDEVVGVGPGVEGVIAIVTHVAHLGGGNGAGIALRILNGKIGPEAWLHTRTGGPWFQLYLDASQFEHAFPTEADYRLAKA